MTGVLVVLGALAGAPLRLLAERVATARRGPGSVLGTLAVNVAGSLLLGLLLGAQDVPAGLVALVGTGFCGTLTTFSTLGAELVGLGEQRAVGRLCAYLGATLVLGLGAAAAGYAVAAGF
ncbi:fluoride efflux transporter FluC [Trujillonella endophytica]|uniref:Fluoride-specific ion channel FluC n=1 Tax=Trujillonella endophytica TaxID=673521 RepID=A0A1H8V880_9ACTN|nr:CrcB family protein [Trujillella endophytica]SEP11670.1 CrcB protein [Trujillella endophytica]